MVFVDDAQTAMILGVDSSIGNESWSKFDRCFVGDR